MLLIEHSDYNEGSIRSNFGAPHYSYWYVRSAFRPVIERLGARVEVTDPAQEVDPIFHAARERGEQCVFLSFSPPQRTVLGLACPTLPIFAWEYNTVPNETWNENPKEDWTHVFGQTGAAVSLSTASADAVRLAMGDDFPVWAIPSPLYDTFARMQIPAVGYRAPFDLDLEGAVVVSAGDMDLSRFVLDEPAEEGLRALRTLEHVAARGGATTKIRLKGVVYTTVACPADGRKNWRDLVSGFVYAFRNTPTATLIFKMTHVNLDDGLAAVLGHLSALGPFSCKVLLVNGLLSDAGYADLIGATSFVVNTSLAEGQCLPLTEYMSAGRPAVAPAHSAMLDYISPENSFVVRGEEHLAFWPQDERLIASCRCSRISFQDYVRQLRESYEVAKNDPLRYLRMSAAAVDSMRAYCSEDVVTAKLREALTHLTSSQRASHRESARADT